MFHFVNKLRDKSRGKLTFEEAFESFSRGVMPIGPFWDHVKGYHKVSSEHPRKILFLTYEDMKMDTVNHVKRLAKSLGYTFTDEEEVEGLVLEIVRLCSFEKLSEVNKYGNVSEGIPNDVFFRKGEVGDWANHLTNEMSQKLDRITKKKFPWFGYLLQPSQHVEINSEVLVPNNQRAELYKMVCELDEIDLDIHIQTVLLPRDVVVE